MGWFVEPTIVRTDDPDFRLLKEELFGPIATAFVYEDAEWRRRSTWSTAAPRTRSRARFSRRTRTRWPGALATPLRGRELLRQRQADGAVVGQQPFGGARASGTNDKAGSLWNLIRWTSPRAVKTTFDPPTDYRYPFMDADASEGAI